MKKKYLFVTKNPPVVQNKNNFLYFGEFFSKYLNYLVSMNEFVVKHKQKIGLFLCFFLLGTFCLSFLIWNVFEAFQVFLEVIVLGANMSEFDELVIWLEKESKKSFSMKKVSFSKIELLNWIFKMVIKWLKSICMNQ